MVVENGGQQDGQRRSPRVNCSDQVRVWISSVALPSKHKARLIRLRAMNPGCRITLIVDRGALTVAGEDDLDTFSARLKIDVRDIGSIEPVDSDEQLILEHVRAEIEAYRQRPKEASGNLSVVADYLRLLHGVVELGLCADMDVEFLEPFGAAATNAPCPLGIVARFKDNGCVSNDITAGVASAQPFRLARRRVADLVDRYRHAVCQYFAAEGIADLVDAATVSSHPRFFELRNRSDDGVLSGTARFSLCGGPDALAIALHEAGISSGYESGTRGFEPGELTSDHVPHVLDAEPLSDGRLSYHPFRFGPMTSVRQETRDRAHLWPSCLPNVMSHWDHSWIADHEEWQSLTYREHVLLTLFEDPEWSLERAADVLRMHPVAGCRDAPTPDALRQVLRPRRSATSRVVALDSMLPADRAVVRERETPSSQFRKALEPRLEADGALAPARQFVENGVVTVHGLIDEDMLRELREVFESEIAGKTSRGRLQQTSFNASVDQCQPSTLRLLRDVAGNRGIVELVEYYLGGTSKFVSARGYRQGPCRPAKYRAWDYHQDMKTKGPFGEVKAMLLLTAVPVGGQAMRFVCGTQALHWDCRTQQDTKFTLEEALSFPNNGLFVGHGAAGTCLLFDTNGIHSGHRNMSVTRDVITLNFIRATPNAYFMFSDPLLTEARSHGASSRPQLSALEWRTAAATELELAAIVDEYRSTSSLDAETPQWDGDALSLVDVVTADLSVDLDLRLGPLPEDDRARDIGLVAIRDAAHHHPQYAQMLRHLGATDVDEHRCLWTAADPLATLCEIAAEGGAAASTRLSGPFAEQCGALLSDLHEALVRVDSVQRLRTTSIFTYFALAWCHRLLVEQGTAGLDVPCRELLHFYVDLVASGGPGRQGGQ